MSLENPLALVLLVVPVVLLWLRTRAVRPRDAEASSLLVWEKVSPADTVPERPRPPLAAWIEAAGAALLALGMAGPLGPAAAQVQGTLLLDTSPSMGRARIDEVRALAARPGTRMDTLYTEDPARDLPALLAAGRPVVVATDHRIPGFEDDPQRLRIVGLGRRAFNAGITGASGDVLPDGRWRVLLVVEAFGSAGPVEGAISVGQEESRVTLQPGVPLVVERVLPAPGDGDRWGAKVAFPGDALLEDDTILLLRSGGSDVTFRFGVMPFLQESWERALLAAGARPSQSSRQPQCLGLSGSPGRHVAINFPLPDSTEVPGVPMVGSDVEGRRVVAGDHPLVRDVLVDPSVTLGRRDGPSPSGTILLGDDDGCLVGASEEKGGIVLQFGFDPGGSWVERDPSFVVLVKNLVDYASGGPARIEAGLGVLSSKETREAAEGETFGSLRAAIEEAARPDPASRASYAFVLLMMGGGALAAAWLAMR